ncbi:DNA repair protein UVH3 isoform X13 [Vigna angularis]|uniref:DNA repair protein UVH3 isoform X13 n=1 Tax=Phaseolus angularis TaxID=3914 RepID=UPI0022B4A4D3|nr:DNA repair protein UVH3 isoform X13 [Vigna angularis]
MGVHGLWELLSPVGRRVSVETLAGKTLAVDASIWMVQFMKAMRDEKGEMVRNAHLLGFFRRICKLLFLRTKPVFVFDGGTPALKRRTVIARRRQRENAQAKVRKTAEKMLLNHLKTLRLKELADDIKSQRMQKNSNTKGQNVSKEKDFVGSDSRGSHVKELDEMSAAKFATKEDINSSQATLSSSYNQEELDEMLAASIAAEESGKHARKGVPSIIINPSEEEHGAEEQILLLLWLYLYFFPPQPSVNAEVDIAVLAALPQSMQLDILAQLKGKKKEGLLKEVYNHEQHDVDYQGKGKGILLSEAGMVGCSSRHDTIAPRTDNQDSIDEMLAASIALEENEKLVNNASTSVGASTIEEDEVDYDEDEEMILPAMHGEVDPLVLASLPPSMQLDLLVQMRERLIAENRHKYQKVKKDPAKFSELQIQAYLKTVAFRREINEVQKAAAGGGVEGVQTSRIASEANREYIFSSSFTGDKQWDSHPCSEDSISDTNIMTKDQVPVVEKKLSDEHDNDKVSSYHKNTPKAVPVGATEEEKKNYIKEPEPFSNCTDTTKPTIHLGESSLKGVTEELIEPNLASEGNNGIFFDKRNSSHGSDTVNSPGDFPALATQVRLEKEIHILGQEYINLENEQRKLERNAESVNSELFTECQELLQMFGLPYIIAPMEAEAQCAYLELEKLVDGVVTDDSDVLLFGARSVYKNIFDDRKYVETYFMEDIEKELGLTREKLIRMALLLGSDYTEGVSGIGIVNAIEVLNAFPEEDGLLKFRKWVESPDPTILGRLDAKSGSNSRKKGSKVEEKINSLNCDAKESPSEQNLPHALEQNKLPDYIQETKQTFFNKHRNVSKNWHIPSSFPSETVISAYCSPHVDKSTEPFTWGKPDHLVLRKLCWEKFGWIGQKADELLLPVLKEYNKRETQLRLEAFYSFNERFAKIRSKRIKKAVKGITGKLPSDMIDDSAEVLSKSRKIGREPEDSTLEISGGTDKRLERQRKSKIKQSTKRKNDTVAKEQSKKKKDNDDPSSAPGTSEMENLQPSMQTEEQCDGKALIQNTSGRGRHRGMGIKRGRDNENLSSSASSDIDDQGSRVHVDKFSEHVRKSLRSRKPVNYSFEDPEDEDADDAFDRSNRTGPIEEKLSQIHGASEDGPTDFSAMNFPLRENSPTDPFKSEGPFCVHAGEINHPSTGNHDSSTGNHDSSDDYLKMGGGFCLDDGETDKLDTIDDVNTATVDSTQDFSHFSDCLDETNRDKNSSDILFSGTEKPENGSEGGVDFYDFGIKRNDLVNTSSYDHSDVGILKPENVHNNSGASAGVFSAMPFLRKRRKK